MHGAGCIQCLTADSFCHEKERLCSPPYTSCETPQLKAEIAGSRYAIVDDSGDEERLQEDLCILEKMMKPDGCNSELCEASTGTTIKGPASTSSSHTESQFHSQSQKHVNAV